jgi:hypothetical protein
LLLGVAAGIISAVVTLILIYVGSVIAIAVEAPDIATTLFAAVTYLLFMVLFVIAPPDIIIGVLNGLLLGLFSRLYGRTLGLFTGALIGLVLAEIVFSLLVPFIMPPSPSGDFVTIVSNVYLSGAYGLTIGALTGILFRRFNRGA